MHHLGFNAVILPKDQPLGDWYAEDYASKTVPDAWASKLDDTRQLIDRYPPRLRQRLVWPEQRWTILVVGLGVEHVLDNTVTGDSRISEAISPGGCVVGCELHNALELRPGQEIVIRGQRFRIDKCASEMGTKDDITFWMNLVDAQQLVGMPQVINEIMLVEHLAVWGDLTEIRRRIARILPECQVIQIASDTLSRTHARVKTAEEAQATAACPTKSCVHGVIAVGITGLCLLDRFLGASECPGSSGGVGILGSSRLSRRRPPGPVPSGDTRICRRKLRMPPGDWHRFPACDGRHGRDRASGGTPLMGNRPDNWLGHEPAGKHVRGTRCRHNRSGGHSSRRIEREVEMFITQMAFREIRRRKLTYMLLAAAVALAAGTMIAVQAIMEQYRVRLPSDWATCPRRTRQRSRLR